MIDTYPIGGPGKQLLQFFSNGAKNLSELIVAGFWRGPEGKWQFRDAVMAEGVRFEVLRQAHAYDPTCISSAVRLVRENDIQILESHGYKAHVVCLVVSRTCRIPWVAFVHGWTSENKKMLLYNLLEKILIRFADRIVPVSESLKNRLKLGKRAEKKTTVITNAAQFVDTSRPFPDKRAELGIGKDAIVIAVIGRFSPEKGVRYFVKAMALLAGKFPQVKAVLVGDGVERLAIEGDLRRMGLQEAVILAGFQDDVSPYYHCCDILCMPSLSEGMPNVALEAMMFGKPVVATDVGGIPEVVIDAETGLLVESCNPEALAGALETLILDEKRRVVMGGMGKRRVESSFGSAKRVDDLFHLFNGILKNWENRGDRR